VTQGNGLDFWLRRKTTCGAEERRDSHSMTYRIEVWKEVSSRRVLSSTWGIMTLLTKKPKHAEKAV
jgi:hypothetical protein